eukprot:TRINITY_DN64998_c0_g1_i1.p1 TRINITY_DN64998_c0_g1~~TRINITY_DN64998_c0_g1_i1.p1  ORF type:complete len:329 (+),score=33.99 TRINITY_DN64998_c0_g1_i1:98-988(+)
MRPAASVTAGLQTNAAPLIRTSAGVSMPLLIYGTAWKKERTAALVEEALLRGFRGIDTACQPRHYREDLVGAALRAVAARGIPRESIFLQTKFTAPDGQDVASTPYNRAAPVEEQVQQSFAASQRNLGTAYVDSLVLHGPERSYTETLRVWRAMEAIVRQGGARQLGIANCYDLPTLQALHRDANVKPAVVQNRFYRDSGFDVPLRNWCASQGIWYQSFWTLTANPDLLNSAPVRHAAARRGWTPEQVLFRYLTQSGAAPLTGTTSALHMCQDLAIFTGTLDDGELAAMDSLLPRS